MATFKGVIFANRTAFQGVETAVFNHYNAKYPNHGVTSKWSNGIDSLNDTKVLMQVDERVMDFPWNPHAIIDVDTTNTKWFSQNVGL